MDLPWYNHHASERPLFSGDKLPALSFAPAVSSASSPSSSPSTAVSSQQDSAVSLSSYSQASCEAKSPPSISAADGVGVSIGVGVGAGVGVGVGVAAGSMNQTQPYMDVQSSHLASSQPYTSQGTPTENSISHYPQYQQPSLLQPGPTAYAPSHNYPPQYGYSNGITSPPSNQPVPNPLNGQGPTQILPLPRKLKKFSPSHIEHSPHLFWGVNI